MPGIRYKGQVYSGAASVGNADEVSVNDGSGQVTDTQTIISRILGDFAEIESSTTASKAYAVGDYLVLNGYFYKATAAIAIDDELVEGTNIEKTTVASIIPKITTESINFTGVVSGSATIYKIGKMCVFCINNNTNLSAITKQTGYSIGTISEEFRPKSIYRVYPLLSSGYANLSPTYPLQLILNTNGIIQIFGNVDCPACGIFVNTCYLTM